MKKFLAVVLTFTLLLTALPVAFAATVEPSCDQEMP